MRKILALIGALGLALLLAAPASADFDGGQLHTAIGWKGTHCYTTHPDGTSPIYAAVKVTMTVYNGKTGRNSANYMKARARMESGTGIQPGAWGKTQVSGRLQHNRAYHITTTVYTPLVSPFPDWKVHVQLIWNRANPWLDVVRDFRFSLNCNPLPLGSG
jgi:hypothetical protein